MPKTKPPLTAQQAFDLQYLLRPDQWNCNACANTIYLTKLGISPPIYFNFNEVIPGEYAIYGWEGKQEWLPTTPEAVIEAGYLVKR